MNVLETPIFNVFVQYNLYIFVITTSAIFWGDVFITSLPQKLVLTYNIVIVLNFSKLLNRI